MTTTVGYTNMQNRRIGLNLNPWTRDAGLEEPQSRSILEFFLGMMIMVRLGLPGGNFFIGDAAALILVFLSLGRPALYRTTISKRFLATSLLLLIYLCVETYINDESFWRRASKIAILLIVAGFVGTGRLDLVQLIRGLGLGLFLNIGVYYLHLTPDFYKGCLTGLIGDKNVAGLYYAVGTVLVMMVSRTRFQKILVFGIGTFGVIATLSRTSMVALGFAMIWFFFSRRAGIVLKLVYLAVVTFGYQYLETRFSKIGVFSDRIGSDQLRARIDAATQIVASKTPWFGQGLGTATVSVNDHMYFFHNSYIALFVEGGFILAIIATLAYAIIGMRVVSNPPFSESEMYIQAASVVVLVCATRLGEVFFTLPSLIVIGAAMQAMSIRIVHGGKLAYAPAEKEVETLQQI